ncbi:MAG: hypothetical protein E7073_02550 [Bacteroidales bacterium]|nr:hypothetical protein [Bacteroidales bacterium]
MNLQEIYTKLKLTEDSLIRVSADKNWQKKVALPSRIYRLLEKNDLLKTLDAFFCFDNKPLILFFNLENNNRKQELHKAIWNFNESPIAIIVENNAVEIFNGFSIDENTKLLHSIGGVEKLDDFAYFELVTGKTWEKYQKDLSHKNRVDYKLLENIEATQQKLMSIGLTQKVANALIGKIVFIRYLIDRQVQLHFEEVPKKWSNDELCELLKDKQRFASFVCYLEDSKKGFNGDMFRLDSDEFETISCDALNVIIDLLSNVEIKTGQLSLFDLYDFSILPVEFISNVYEKFIGKENQDKEGAYYTPTFLVDYIVQQTIGKRFEQSNDYNCKVLDPACGSGIFLVESLRRIIDKYIETNDISDEERNSEEFRTALRELASNNIYGIDKDESAIQVAIFSIDLTLLDYQKPADIEKFKFPKLFGKNLIHSDAFDTSNELLRYFSDNAIQFDYIIGNPPWMRGRIVRNESGEIVVPQYIRYLKDKRLSTVVGNKELAQAFVLRSMDFASSNTQFALVLTSKVLYNLQSQSFRKYLLDNLFLEQVFEMAPVRKEIFIDSNDSAIAPACVLFFHKANGIDPDTNVLEHIALKPSRFFSLFKVLALTKNDIQRVKQSLLKENDWLWKVLVYGSYLDFLFIKRLKKFQILNDYLKDNRIVFGQGITVGGGDKNNTDCLINLPLVEAKHIYQYYIQNPSSFWTGELVHRTRDFRLYKAPLLLTTKGVMADLKAESAISERDVVYKDAVTGIHSEDVALLRNIEGLWNSSFFAYYNINTFSSSGIEREQALIKEKMSVPFVYFDIQAVVKKLEDLVSEYNTSTMKSDLLLNEINKLKRRLDKAIAMKLKCSQLELDLIDYANTVSIPLAIKTAGYEDLFYPIAKNDVVLKHYAKAFLDRFANSFNKIGKRFAVEVLYSQQYIGMLFKVVEEKEFVNEYELSECDNPLLASAISFSSMRITDQLFVQKDIRGFEKEFFYIFKPNEKRLWHKAIAHLDVNEFSDAMLRAGGNRNE